MNARKDQRATSGSMTRRERRAAERSARRSGSVTASSRRSGGPSMLVVTVAAVVLSLVAILALVALSGGLGGDEAAAVSAPDEPPPAQELRVGRSLGDPDAPVKIDAYEDPQCPACGLYTERIEPLLIAGPVSEGRVFLTFKDYPFLGQESLDAAVAMRVAEDLGGKFWDLHQLIYHNQEGENRGAFSLDRLADMAELIDLDRTAFLDAMKDPKYQADVQAEYGMGVALGITSTPTLVVNGELMRGVPTWEDLSAQIETAEAAAAAEAESQVAPATAAPGAEAEATSAAGGEAEATGAPEGDIE